MTECANSQERHDPYTISPAFMVLIFALGFGNWAFAPEDSWRWALAMSIMPVLMGGLQILKLSGRCSAFMETRLRASILCAGFVLSASLAVKFAYALQFLSGDAPKRAMGVMLGVLLVMIGNAAPKMLAPLSEKSCAQACTQAEQQAIQRFMGWAFVIAGFLMAGIWLTLPVGAASDAALFVNLAAVALVLGRLVIISNPALFGKRS